MRQHHVQPGICSAAGRPASGCACSAWRPERIITALTLVADATTEKDLPALAELLAEAALALTILRQAAAAAGRRASSR